MSRPGRCRPSFCRTVRSRATRAFRTACPPPKRPPSTPTCWRSSRVDPKIRKVRHDLGHPDSSHSSNARGDEPGWRCDRVRCAVWDDHRLSSGGVDGHLPDHDLIDGVTGFPLAPFGLDPPRIVGIILICALGAAGAALYAFALTGAARSIYVVCAVLSLFGNGWKYCSWKRPEESRGVKLSPPHTV